MTIRSAQRNCKIIIQSPVNVKQPNGSMKTTWGDYITLWARIETLFGSEKVAATAAWPKAAEKITFRYVAGVLPTMRVLFNNKIYSILNVNNVDERNREIILTTESGVMAG
jgi:SPP1 family predicted phage head-tail adaptor